MEFLILNVLFSLFFFRSNCLHGWAASGGHWDSSQKWTVFPTPIALAASFNLSLVEAVADVTSDEGRALHNMNLDRFNGSSVEAAGLNCFSPNVNLYRDPRYVSTSSWMCDCSSFQRVSVKTDFFPLLIKFYTFSSAIAIM